jgi:hypothetical protein
MLADTAIIGLEKQASIRLLCGKLGRQKLIFLLWSLTKAKWNLVTPD